MWVEIGSRMVTFSVAGLNVTLSMNRLRSGSACFISFVWNGHLILVPIRVI